MRIKIEPFPNGGWEVSLKGADSDRRPRFTLIGFGWWLRAHIPVWMQPSDQHVYGIRLYENHLSLHYGRNPQWEMCSKDQRWSCFLPWTEWEHVRKSGYGQNGEWLFDEPQGRFMDTYDEREALSKSQYKAKFQFSDFDGEVITAACAIEEREWHKGVGSFRWLRWFSKPKISRSLDLSFSSEVGRRKGSWKGGTVGHSIEMLPGELHEAAFRRYCDKQSLTFIGATP